MLWGPACSSEPGVPSRWRRLTVGVGLKKKKACSLCPCRRRRPRPGRSEPAGEEEAGLHPRADRHRGTLRGRPADRAGGEGGGGVGGASPGGKPSHAATSLQVFHKPMSESGRLKDSEMVMIFVNWKELLACNSKLVKCV